MVSTQAFSLYVHWPWCRRKCPYCDFNSHAWLGEEQGVTDLYVERVCAELAWWRLQLNRPMTLESVFFGGGTPSLMKIQHIEKILAACELFTPIREIKEITLEANPTSSDKNHYKRLRGAGVNRLSLGLQALEDKYLRFLGREHSATDASACLDDALEVFPRVSADVIYGLPEQNLQEWERLLKNLAGRGTQHLSAYQLTVEKNTRFYSDVRRGLWTPVESDVEADFFDITRTCLERSGFDNYEISNFARPGEPCLYNLRVWQGRDYIGVGCGAHGRITLDNGRRMATAVLRQPKAYMDAGGDGPERFSVWEEVAAAQELQEALFLGLRLKDGVDLHALWKKGLKPVWESAVDAEKVQAMVDAGFLMRDETRLALTQEGWPRLNSILRMILPSLHTK